MHELYDYTETYIQICLYIIFIKKRHIYMYIFSDIHIQYTSLYIYLHLYLHIYILVYVYIYIHIYIYSDVSKAGSLQKQNPKQKKTLESGFRSS